MPPLLQRADVLQLSAHSMTQARSQPAPRSPSARADGGARAADHRGAQLCLKGLPMEEYVQYVQKKLNEGEEGIIDQSASRSGEEEIRREHLQAVFNKMHGPPYSSWTQAKPAVEKELPGCKLPRTFKEATSLAKTLDLKARCERPPPPQRV